MRRLDGKVIIVTGGGSGIGATSARMFAAEGAMVGLCDHDAAGIDAVVSDIQANGGEALGQVADVSSSNQVEAFVKAVISRFGRLDGLFSNAGISGRGTVVEMSEADFDTTLSVNVGGAFLCAKHAVPHLTSAGGGSIVMTASELALVGSRNNAAYTASKAALIGMARSMALDHARDGIRVNVLCPGPIETPMLRRSIERHADSAAYQQMILDETPLHRIGQPEEIARVALFLLSDDSSYMTGSTVVVDGGATAQ